MDSIAIDVNGCNFNAPFDELRKRLRERTFDEADVGWNVRHLAMTIEGDSKVPDPDAGKLLKTMEAVEGAHGLI